MPARARLRFEPTDDWQQLNRLTQFLEQLTYEPTTEKHQRLPAQVRAAILARKAEHPALRTQEITTICWARFGHRPSPHTVKRILAEGPCRPCLADAFSLITMLPKGRPPTPPKPASRSSACIWKAGRWPELPAGSSAGIGHSDGLRRGVLCLQERVG